MAKQYWLGDFFVDLSRNQISRHDQPQILAPKALLVLTHLAENQGKVVSQEELLNKVWPNSVVTPNTLQRSIAQLRKALGENSKAQSIIKTHAKQGYSLECGVTWSADRQTTDNAIHAPIDEDPKDNGSDHPEYKSSVNPIEKTGKKTIWIGTVVAALLLVILLLQFQNDTPQIKFDDLRYLTATDDKEYGATYSPDGKFILFHRYLNKVCINNIWAKNADTLEEIQLTKEQGTYDGHSLSEDGKTLAFIKQEDCTKPVTQTTCYKLMSLNFNEALLQPQTAKELLHCQNSAIKKPVWIDDRHIAMMQKNDQHWRLIRYSIENKSSSKLYEIDGGNILSFAYSTKRQLFAVTAIKNDGRQYIEMLFPDGTIKSSHLVQLPENAPRHLRVYPRFAPNSEKLILGFGGQLYTVSEQGEVSKVEFPFDTRVGGPSFHPDGERLLLIKGLYDSDVATLPVPTVAANQDNLQENQAAYKVLERSIQSDDYAKFQPNGHTIAFASERTGSEQVWLMDDGGTTVISKFTKGNFIRNLHWDSDGNSLLVLANLELHQLFLNTDSTAINFRYPVTRLFHWDSNKRQVIANILVNGIKKFVKIDLNTLGYEIINNKMINWAAKSENSSLIFMDHMGRLWQKGAVEDKLIEPLLEQGSSKRFVLRSELIYGINSSNQLWSYNLQSGAFKLLADVTKDIDYITDINDNELLVTVVVAAKKEVIELSVTRGQLE